MFGKKILDYWEDIIEDCKGIISIPSVAVNSSGEFPYGKNAALAVDYIMEFAKKYGFTAKNVDYHACHVEIGDENSSENAVVMAHVDVVPAGEGWISDPFELVLRDGFLYGRGIADDKGPAIIALHCLRALRDSNVLGKRKLRVVLGSAEEIGMTDIPYYFEREQAPTLGFTPDGYYGLCNCEKGHINFKVSNKNTSTIVKSFKSGTVVNAVPYKAEACIVCSEEELNQLVKSGNENDFAISKTNEGATITANGVAAHASTPELGRNAASMLIDLLYSVFGNKIGDVLSFAQSKIGLKHDGSKIGVADSDTVSGNLTFNLGIVNTDLETSELLIDIRFPATQNSKKYMDIIQKNVADCGLVLSDIKCAEALYVSEDKPLISMLKKSYEDITGENCEIFSMGGGTYAKTMLGKGVAFGPTAMGEDTHIHDCNENISVESFKLHAQICLEAMYRMYTADEV